MSVKEKLERFKKQEEADERLLQESKQAQLNLQRAQETQKLQEHQAKYSAGLPEAETQQIRLFKQLERAGLIAIITEATGRRFFAPKMSPLLKEDGTPDLSKVKWPSAEEVREAFNHHGWQVT